MLTIICLNMMYTWFWAKRAELNNCLSHSTCTTEWLWIGPLDRTGLPTPTLYSEFSRGMEIVLSFGSVYSNIAWWEHSAELMFASAIFAMASFNFGLRSTLKMPGWKEKQQRCHNSCSALLLPSLVHILPTTWQMDGWFSDWTEFDWSHHSSTNIWKRGLGATEGMT